MTAVTEVQAGEVSVGNPRCETLVRFELARTLAPVQDPHGKKRSGQGDALRAVEEIAVSIQANRGCPIVISPISVVDDICSKHSPRDTLIGSPHGEVSA